MRNSDLHMSDSSNRSSNDDMSNNEEGNQRADNDTSRVHSMLMSWNSAAHRIPPSGSVHPSTSTISTSVASSSASASASASAISNTSAYSSARQNLTSTINNFEYLEGTENRDEDEEDEEDEEKSEIDRDKIAAAKRKEIQSIMKSKHMSELEKRLKIQNLMDGRGTIQASTSLSNSSIGGMSFSFSGRNGIGFNRKDSKLPGSNPISIENNIPMSCVHYERKCNIVAPCCNKVFGCRICHDETMISSHGPMDRFAIKEIVCKECNTRQPKSNKCVGCGIVFAEYHCNKCNIWMALEKQPFHCDHCGFCRVGGRSKFRHCHMCCMCIDIRVYDNHSCLKDKYKNNCPVCREDMFSSRQPPLDLPCGHAIHSHCFRKLSGFDYRCPICKKTAVSKESMASAWSARAYDIANQPMPSDLDRIVSIMCNDCEEKTDELHWHFLGVQCPKCDSFNTVEQNPPSPSTSNTNDEG